MAWLGKTIAIASKFTLIVSFLGMGVAPTRASAYARVEHFSYGSIFPSASHKKQVIWMILLSIVAAINEKSVVI